MATSSAPSPTPAGPGLPDARDPGSGPWRRIPAPSRRQLAALVAALCLLAGAMGWSLAQDRPPGRDSADVGFLYDMSAHHEGAITLSAIALDRVTTGDVRTFAREISLFQSYEIGLMDAWLDQWGYAREDRSPVAMGWMGHEVPTEAMPGMASEAQLAALRAASGTDADALFVALMIEHHRAGAEMASAAADLADDGYVRELAARMARYQRLEVQEMEAALQRQGLAPAAIDVGSADDGSSADGGSAGGAHGHG